MKIDCWGVAIAAAAIMACPSIAHADAKLFQTEAQAKEYCKADMVVWIDINREKFYRSGTSKYGQGTGAYGCEKEAMIKYRSAKDE